MRARTLKSLGLRFDMAPEYGTGSFRVKSVLRKQLLATYAPFTGYFDTEPAAAAKTDGLRRAMKQSRRFLDRNPSTRRLRLTDELLEKLTKATEFSGEIGQRDRRVGQCNDVVGGRPLHASNIAPQMRRLKGAPRLILDLVERARQRAAQFGLERLDLVLFHVFTHPRYQFVAENPHGMLNDLSQYIIGNGLVLMADIHHTAAGLNFEMEFRAPKREHFRGCSIVHQKP